MINLNSFARSITLPAHVDSSKINAILKDGILEVTLNKVEKSKRRRIEVQ